MAALRIPGVALRPASAALGLARRAERGARRRLVEEGGRVTLVFVDAALASPYAEQAVQRVLDSELAERTVARALSGGLVDVVAVDLVEYRVVERVVDKLLVRDAIDRALDRLDAAGVPAQVA